MQLKINANVLLEVSEEIRWNIIHQRFCSLLYLGDSRLMISLLFTGIQTMFLRAHNQIAKFVIDKLPVDHQADRTYEYTRTLTTAYFQKIIYEEWLPILLGPEVARDSFPILQPTEFTTYNPQVDIRLNG